MRLLSMGTYPVGDPLHGGQFRVNALHQVVQKAGWVYEYLCVYDPNGYPGETDKFWMRPFTQDFLADLARKGQRPDVHAADFLLSDPEIDDVFAAIGSFAPDIIALEQPWLWPVAQQYLESAGEGHRACKIVYSSQNNEMQMLWGISKDLPETVRIPMLQRVEELEGGLLAAADLTLAVSETDAAVFQSRCKKVVVVPNGVWPPAEKGGWEYWSSRYDNKSIILFVGSAHPPNAVGFFKMLGPALGYLAPNHKVVVVGGVAHILGDVPGFRANKGINVARIDMLGVQDSGGLATLLKLADIIVLPITEGGGTNIKTAEALVNGKRIVATQLAFRGYERFIGRSGVYICNEPESFKAKIVELLAEPTPLPQDTIAPDVHSLLWHNTLSEVPGLLRSLLPAIRITASKTVFDVENGLANVLGAGWNPPDLWGAWSKEQGATIRFCMSEGTRLPLRGILECTAYTPTGDPVELSGRAKGKELFRVVFTQDLGLLSVEFVILESELDPDRTFSIEARASVFKSPANYCDSGDQRQLGFGLHSVTLITEGAMPELG